MTLQIYNTLKRAKEPFVPLEPGKISMYVCGNTVYDYAHIGHARVMVSFDVIVRYLRARGWDVTYVRNITDIDDKILNRANENGEAYTALTARMIDAQHEDEFSLGVAPPDIEPRATAHIEDIIDMVQNLIDNHYAYMANNGDVYYRVKRFPEYGKLSGKKPDELLAGARVEIGDLKEDPRDFALWKAAPEEEVGWQSPWGWGRPGWHIECSAMSTCHLGDSFDIHGGGPDLVFPHHENEIAQSEAATHKHYVNYWMHAGAVRVNDEKMSKSLGNFFTIREVLAKYHPEVVRFFLISSHYRSPINYSEDNLIEAKSGLERFYAALRGVTGLYDISTGEMHNSPFYQRFVAAMDDDFNTREAIAVLYDLVRDLNNAKRDSALDIAARLASELKALGVILGICQDNPDGFFQGVATSDDGGLSAAAIQALIDERLDARNNKNFARSDEIRDQLKAQGIELEDSKDGTIWKRR
ncbi:MAG: cysteine--tRNA ligase [Porticoccaceae bacterium]|nr:cysteine--tRNA ligase [Porticoccaceae bacterium]